MIRVRRLDMNISYDVYIFDIVTFNFKKFESQCDKKSYDKINTIDPIDEIESCGLTEEFEKTFKESFDIISELSDDDKKKIFNSVDVEQIPMEDIVEKLLLRIVAKDNEQIVGIFDIYYTDHEFKAAQPMIAIKEQYRNQGIGKELTTIGLNCWKSMFLEIPLKWIAKKDNEASIKLALENGFIESKVGEKTFCAVLWENCGKTN